MKTRINDNENNKLKNRVNKIIHQSIYEKGEKDREKKEMAHCTFTPKITELNREMFYKNTDIIFDESNELFIKRMKQRREEMVIQDTKKKEIADKRCRITIPKEFKINERNKTMTKHAYDIDNLLRYNIKNGIKIDKRMNYTDAVKLLHNELLNTNNNNNEANE